MSFYYAALRRGIKWYRKVALELITGTAIVNSWILHKNSAGKSLNLLEFRKILARHWLQTESDSEECEVRPKRYMHTLKYADERRRCIICYTNLKKLGISAVRARDKCKKVYTYCEDCENRSHFCRPCFNKFHKNV